MRQKCAITGSFERLRNTLQVPSFMRAEERPGNIDQFHSYPPNSSQACSVSSENSMPRTHKNCTIYLATFLTLYGLVPLTSPHKAGVQRVQSLRSRLPLLSR